jgi:hypothetical protein
MVYQQIEYQVRASLGRNEWVILIYYPDNAGGNHRVHRRGCHERFDHSGNSSVTACGKAWYRLGDQGLTRSARCAMP